MTRPRNDARRAVIQTANRIKVGRRRGYPAGFQIVGRGQGARVRAVTVHQFPTKLFNMRQIDQAVSLIRRRGTDKEKAVLVAAGYRPSKRRSSAA